MKPGKWFEWALFISMDAYKMHCFKSEVFAILQEKNFLPSFAM